MAEDDRALMERLAALEAEVKADADAQRARKEAAVAKVRDQRAQQQAERDQLRTRQAAIVGKKRAPSPEPDADDDPPPRSRRQTGDDLGDALALARKASSVKQELQRKPKKGEKSWVKSGVASLALGPIGWLYAGSLRESVPAAAGWLLLAAIASKILPSLLLMPVLFVALPLSGLAGVLYALAYNRKGSRQRLFGDKAKQKQLRGG